MKRYSEGVVYLVLLFILFLIIVTGIGYYVYKNGQINLIPHQVQPSPTPTHDSTANWKTCTNTSNGFSIKYPNDYIVDQATCVYFPPNEAVKRDSNDVKKTYVITITTEETTLSIEQWIKQKNLCPDWGTEFPSCSDIVKGPILNSIQFDNLNRHYAGIDTIVKQGDTIYDISLGARNPNEPISKTARNVYNQILSTFKFTNPENSEGKFCGGIAGISCPEDYRCKLDGNYPDAGGKCVKD